MNSRPTTIAVALLFLALSLGLTRATAQGLDVNDYIAVQKGNLPIILSAPHGGQKAIPGVEPRKGEGVEKGPRGFVDTRDSNVDLVAFEVSAALEKKLGKKPYYVVAKFHRKFVDANRSVEIAAEDPKAKAVYEGYHGALRDYCAEAAREFGFALVLDIHGQGTSATAVFRGTQGGKTDRSLVKQFGEKAHSGPESFCGLFAAQGVSVVPINKSPETSGFGGGYIVRVCGDRESVGAIQLEFGMDFRKAANIKTTAAKLSDAIIEFLKIYQIDKKKAAQAGEAPAPTAAPEVEAALRAADDSHDLWDHSKPVPKTAEIPPVQGVTFHVIKKHEPEKDGYPWLHGVGLAWHKGKLYASFGHNKGSENTAGEQARGRVSEDGGQTWGDVFTIDAGTDAPDLAVSHGVFLSHDGVLWAFHGAFYGRMGRVHTRAYTLDEGTGKWRPKGVVIEGGFWPLNPPVKLSDGAWIMPGICVGGSPDSNIKPPAVAISRGADFTKWDLVAIAAPAGVKVWGESAIIVDGPHAVNIARFGEKAQALVARSGDFGRTWTASAPGNLPMATSKPCAGTLANGQRYLICTTTADSGGRRSPLTIAVSRAGESLFSKVFIIRPAVFPEGPGESHARAALSYPCAAEHDGKLYVGYSNSGGRAGNHNSAELAVIPIQNLRVEP